MSKKMSKKLFALQTLLPAERASSQRDTAA
jgi:hypothetical protein